MIILSVGMPRAGSGWYYNLTNDLMLAEGAQDARQIRQRYHLETILTEVNCNIGALTPRRLLMVLVPSMMGNTFVIKAHSAPTPIARWMIRRGLVCASYIYRDPRDALLSAYENGQRAIQRGKPNAFSHLTDFDQAVKFMAAHMKVWEGWKGCENVLKTRYEDLLTEYDLQVRSLIDFLPVQSQNPSLKEVVDQYRPENAQPDQKGLHFSHGKIGRFRQKMSAEQQETLAYTFFPYLERMGYDV